MIICSEIRVVGVNYDYKTSFTNTILEYKLTDIRIRKEHCNNFFPFHPTGDNYNILEKYSINGVAQTEATFVIRK